MLEGLSAGHRHLADLGAAIAQGRQRGAADRQPVGVTTQALQRGLSQRLEPGAFKLGSDLLRQLDLRPGSRREALAGARAVETLRQTVTQQDHYAVVVVGARGASHALFEPLDLPGNQEL